MECQCRSTILTVHRHMNIYFVFVVFIYNTFGTLYGQIAGFYLLQ